MPKGLATKTTALIAEAAAVLERLQPMTVRGVCYQLFTRGVIPSMHKNETDRVSRALTAARERGLVPWDWIVDETREAEQRPSWASRAAFVASVQRSYRKDRWAMQPERVEVVSEKGTVAGVLRPVIHRYGVALRTFHGFGSATALNDLAAASVADVRPMTIVYVGDHDPSGRHMSDADIPDRLARYGGDARILRLAVTPEQIGRHGLPTFSAHDKRTDARYRWFLRAHGDVCCELDALDPNVLRAAVEAAIRERIDLDLWERAEAVEAVEAASLAEVLAAWPGAA